MVSVGGMCFTSSFLPESHTVLLLPMDEDRAIMAVRYGQLSRGLSSAISKAPPCGSWICLAPSSSQYSYEHEALLAPNLNVGDRLLVKDDPVMLVLVGLGSTTAHEKFVGGLKHVRGTDSANRSRV